MYEGTLVNLRAPEMTDLDRNFHWVNDREVTRFLVLRYPMSLLAEEEFMKKRTSSAIAFDDVMTAIETTEGRHIGNCGLHRASTENRGAELGIMIGEKDCWNRGFGTDTVRTLLRFGFEEMNLNRIWLGVFDFNERGIAAYRKAGMVEEGRAREAVYTEGAYHDIVHMSVLRREWEAAR